MNIVVFGFAKKLYDLFIVDGAAISLLNYAEGFFVMQILK